ncbi:MAG TPA: polysaccharide deacetylase family protein [Candidatus Binatia bacterium]|nr:polysaccharide deacetylase family protein [Candidatus Binatia bacterium]
MRVLSPILRQFVYPTLSKVGYFSSRKAASVLTYHGVLPEHYRKVDSFIDSMLITAESFRAQIRMLKRQHNIISPEHFHDWLLGSRELPQRAMLLTCDDGLLNNLTVMTPILREEGLQCLFFVTGASLDKVPQILWYIELYLMIMEAQRNHSATVWRGMDVPEIDRNPRKRRPQWLALMTGLSAFEAPKRAFFLQEAEQRWGVAPDWKRRYLDDPLLRQRFQPMGAAELRQLADAGMTIGSHTFSHPELSRQTEGMARREIIDFRRELEICTQRAVWALAYPFGNPSSVGERELQLAEEAGYNCAFMNMLGEVAAKNRFALPRVHVGADMNLAVLEAHATGLHHDVQRWLSPSVPINVLTPEADARIRRAGGGNGTSGTQDSSFPVSIPLLDRR